MGAPLWGTGSVAARPVRAKRREGTAPSPVSEGASPDAPVEVAPAPSGVSGVRPRVDERHAEIREGGHVPRHEDEALHERRRGD